MASRPNIHTRQQPLRQHRLASAAAALIGSLAASVATGAQAQASAAPERITITGSRGQQPASVAGFGDLPLSQLPLSATVINRSQLADAGIASLADITRLDADITDAYNAPGYINQLAVRGFTLDNRFNFRRDGLPINAETVIGQANKQALELLKGTSGLQAGTSAPGGLLNLIVKRPAGHVREAALAFAQAGTLEAALDLGDQLGGPDGLGWRVNASATRLDPATRFSRGERGLLAAAADLKLGSTLLEAEIEASRQSQPSTPGFSLLGDRLPEARSIDPRLNLNHQPWTLPVVFEGLTGSLRLQHPLTEDTQLTAHLMRQSLRTDDRIAFPYGCSSENRYDRYCSDGSFDVYDYRSEGERRRTDALNLGVQTWHRWAGMTHRLSGGLLFTHHEARFNRQAFNWVGVGTVQGRSVLPADPSLTDENTQRDERSTEAHLQDAITLDARSTLWLGARHTQIRRDSVRTDGSRATSVSQSFTTPWLAFSHTLQGGASPGPAGVSSPASTLLYASWGRGVESEVAPNRRRYVNAGEALPALQSRQAELGLKHRQGGWEARLAVFDIRRPLWADIKTATGLPAQDDCSDAEPCLRRTDGAARHRGLEAESEWRLGSLSLRGSALWLQARREGSADTRLNGLQPTNVPQRSLKAQIAWSVPQIPGLSLLAFLNHEGQRQVLPDNRVATPGWTRLDLGARWATTLADQRWVLRLALDNATDRRAWQEAPFQFGHAYLYPLAPRSLKLSAEARF
ncbi:MAG: TonB-dependent receptor [Rubrivivax sp.]|nr:TonB-dependent receptor [Rubrivivax sp.]